MTKRDGVKKINHVAMRVPQELWDEIQYLMSSRGMNRTDAMTLAITVGLRFLQRADKDARIQALEAEVKSLKERNDSLRQRNAEIRMERGANTKADAPAGETTK